MRTMWPRLWLVLAALLGPAQAHVTADFTVTATNWTATNTTYAYDHMHFNLSIGHSKKQLRKHPEALASLLPLTSNAEYTSSRISGHPFVFDYPLADPLDLPNHQIALIPCDGWQEETGVQAALGPASSIVWFSRQADWCDFEGSISNIDLIYTVRSLNDTKLIFQVPGMADVNQVLPIYLQISRNGIDYDESKPSTGLIAAFCVVSIVGFLFLVAIIVAIIHIRRRRRRRRNGQVNNATRSPQPSRPRGPATANLEALPIVKFGERPEPRPSDVELGRTHIHQGPPVTGTTRQTHEIELAESSAGDGSMPKQEGVITEQADVTPTHSAAAVTVGRDNHSCSICTEDFEIGQDQRILPCTHRFHPTCVDPWLLQRSATCPLCRTDLQRLTTSSSPEPGRGGHSRPWQREERGNMSEVMGSPAAMRPVSRHSSLGRPHHVAREEWNSATRAHRRQSALRLPQQQREGVVEEESRRQTWLWHTFHIRTRRTGENDAPS